MDVGRLERPPEPNPPSPPPFAATLELCGGERCATARSTEEVAQALRGELHRAGLDPELVLRRGPCRGLCAAGPVMAVNPPGTLYCGLTPGDAGEIVRETVAGGRLIRRLLYQEPFEVQALPLARDLPFFRKQVRIALRNCGVVDPERIDDYIARDGYRGLGKVLTEMPPEHVIREMKESGLRGRGGAGFLTGLKWEICRNSASSPKYVICNADEGDPGAFMDRSILESDPHSVLEGMAIAAYAIGAGQGFIYCREEYPLAINHLQTAIAQAHEYGLLGENILGSGFSFDIQLKEGAGAFVCGEETALIASVEGRRGEPRPRPPYPVVRGLWGQPTNINNVKSYAMTPQIILNGARWFSSIGTPNSPGTAVFALTGKVNNTGLIEVPMGISLGDVIFDIGGGIPRGRPFKAVQTGGPLGGCLPASSLNTPVDFDSLSEAGAVMGSGGMIVVDDDTCMVELAKYFLTFAAAESCGKCVPCRIGGQRLLEALTRITEGRGTRRDLARIKDIADNMMSASLCGLGQRTPGPVLSALRFFQDEFISHIDEKICHAGQCKALVRAKCVNSCPAGVDTPSYLALTAAGRFAEGLEIHRQRNPFALVCGRACPAFCERKCRRGEIDEPVAIRLLKRFMADQEIARPWTPQPVVAPDQLRAASVRRIAIVGSGPAGLTAALRLAQRGYRVTVFEKLSFPGGMMSWAIPQYRLPRELLDAEIDNIRRAGVEIVCNKELGRDFTIDELLGRDGFAALVLAVGAHRSRRMGIPGEDKPGVMNGIEFLRALALAQSSGGGAAPDVRGRRVGVVGGGDVAIDVARAAWRLGAREVHVIYRRAGEHMPATHLPEEIEAARQEGVQFHTLVNPIEVLGEERVTGVRLQQQRLGEFDSSARRRPVPLEHETYDLALDMLIPAVGQVPETAWSRDDQIETARSGTLVVDDAFCTPRQGVFAAGDAVSGPATIVQAVAQGNLVAVAVDHWLRTGTLQKPIFDTTPANIPIQYDLAEYAGAHRPAIPRLGVEQRRGSFQEVELGFDAETARQEAHRCLRCDLEWHEMMQASAAESR